MASVKCIIVKGGKRYDLTKPENSEGEAEEIINVLVNASYRYANMCGMNPFLQGRYLGLIINLDLGSCIDVKPHTAQIIASATGVKVPTALKHIKELERSGALVKTKVDGLDAWSVDYAVIAEVTGVEIISY